MNQHLKNLQKALPDHGLDAFIVRNFEGDNPNVFYLSGFGGTTATLVVTRRKAFIITDARYFLRAEKEAPDFTLIKVERGKKPSEFVNQALSRARLTKASRVGFEAARISVHTSAVWKKELRCRLVPTVHVVERFRQFKDAEEIKQIRRACRVTSRVFNDVVPLIKPGMTESEVAFELDTALRRAGALDNSFPSIVASGPNAAVPHHATGNRKLKAGEPVVLDFGGLFPGGYCSDITRTVFVPGKKPHPRMAEIYNIVLAANKAAHRALKAGMTWKEYDGVAREFIAERGYGKYFTHGLGHSIGLDVHDPYDYEHDPFKEGTVLSNEPGIYIDGFGGVRIEDDVVVTRNGAERLTNAPYLKL